MSQSQRTLNMLRPCRINPKLSADAFLEGQHDYNAVPFPPLRWQMLNFEGPDHRSSWGSMRWRGSVWDPQRKTTCDTGDGSQQQEPSGYQTQWCSFHSDDTRMTSQRPQHSNRWYRRQQKLSAIVSERWQQTTQHTRTCPISLACNKCLTSSTQQRKKLQTPRCRKDRG